MPTDPQAPKVDERRWVLVDGDMEIAGLLAFAVSGPEIKPGERIEVVPASVVDALREELENVQTLNTVAPAAFQAERGRRERAEAERDTARDALREIADALQHGETIALDKIAAILDNGPLATAPGGEREDECFRLREERDALRADVERLQNWQIGARQAAKSLRELRAKLETAAARLSSSKEDGGTLSDDERNRLWALETTDSERREVESEYLDAMTRLRYELVVHNEDDGPCFGCSLSRMFDKLDAPYVSQQETGNLRELSAGCRPRSRS